MRGLVPRTFVDCNREIDGEAQDYARTGITPAVPDYVADPRDRQTLAAMYRQYRAVAERAYEQVCGSGGTALTLHTYAPREVRLERIDGNVVEALRRAYEPERYASWRVRPDVDLITETEDGSKLAPRALVASIRESYATLGIEVTENATYRLHPGTMGHRFSRQYPGRVLCMEISRALLADPFTPFSEMRIGAEKVATMTGPVAAALRAGLA